MFIARCEIGHHPTVRRIDAEVIRLPDYNKDRATILPRQPRSWIFEARRTSLGRKLCGPGAAAIAHTEFEALAAVATLLAEYQRAFKKAA